MRLVLITVSAIALSGCTWFGGGSQSGSYGFNGQSATNCGSQGGYGNGYNLQNQAYQTQGFQGQAYQAQGYQGQGYQAAGCGAAGGYSVAGGQYAQAGGQQGAGYGQGYTAGYATGYGSQTGVQGLRGSYGAAGYGTSGYNGAVGYGQTATTLGSAAPYGAAVAGGQFGGANVQTVQGQPVYVQQPYPVYGGSAGCAPGYNGPGCGVVGKAQPFGIEAGIGTSFGTSLFGTGDLSPTRDETTSNGFGFATDGAGGLSTTRVVSETPAFSYNDAFDETVEYDIAATYDISPNTTILARFGYAEADGNDSVEAGNAFEFATPQNVTGPINIPAGSTASPVTASFTDLEQFTVEAGVRQYVGGLGNGVTGIRPYVGATAGAIRNNGVDVSFSSAAFSSPGGTDAPFEFIDSGWNPTASGVIGAEWQVGPAFAVGAEAGLRWQDGLDGNTASTEDRISVPVRLRGRVSF